MLVASEVKGELARIHPARACCRRAELAGLLHRDEASDGELRTLDHATARVAVQLATSLGVPVSDPPRGATSPVRGRHHLRVHLDRNAINGWSWADAQPHDRRAFIRGALLGAASLSLGRSGPHVEWVYASPRRAAELRRRLADCEISAAVGLRRARTVVYVKGQEEVATLLRLTGANRALLDFETDRVGRDVRNRLNRLLNAEGANLDRTVRAADRQLRAIGALSEAGRLDRLPSGLREAALQRRARPDADLDTLAVALGISRSATNHRLRRLVELADELSDVVTA